MEQTLLKLTIPSHKDQINSIAKSITSIDKYYNELEKWRKINENTGDFN